jgi:hypothetical protein
MPPYSKSGLPQLPNHRSAHKCAGLRGALSNGIHVRRNARYTRLDHWRVIQTKDRIVLTREMAAKDQYRANWLGNL